MRSGFLVPGTIGPNALGGGSGIPADPVPVEGAELVANGDFEDGDPPSNWTPNATAILSRVADSSISGQYALNAARGSDDQVTFQFIAALTNGGWYAASVNARIVTATYCYAAIDSFGDIVSANFTTTWAQKFQTARMTATSGTLRIYMAGAEGTEARVDALSFVALTLSSLISTRAYASADCDISAAVTRTASTQAGLCARLDSASSPANFIIAYETGAERVKVDKCVSGTYTNVIDAAITYVAGRVLRLVCSGNDVSCYYNGVQVGTTVTVADAGIASNVNHGKFSTYASNTLANYVAA